MIDAAAASRSVIGALLLTGARDVDDLDLDAADHQDARLESLHRLILDMHARRQPVDAQTVAARIGGIRGLDTNDILGMVQEVPTAANIGWYARVVREAAFRRRLTTSATRIAQLAEQEGDPDEIAENARTELDAAISGHAPAGDVTDMAQALEEAIDSLTEQRTYVPTPWPDLDHLIGGWRPGALYVIGARPGLGKSVLGLMAAHGIARRGPAVAMSSLEMSRDEITCRLLATSGQVSMSALTRPDTMTERDWEAVAALRGKLSDLPLYVDDRAGVRPVDVRAHARNVSRRHPLGGIVVDYLQLMSPPREQSRVNRQEQVAGFSRYLKTLAKEMAVPVIALSQLNRSPEGRADKRPLMSDLRESGAVEQDADVILLLHRDDDNDPTELDVGVAKNRHGPTGGLTLQWEGHYARAVSRAWRPAVAS